MTSNEPGIWVRIATSGGSDITGFVSGAESPNDFWILFKTHLVRVERATETKPSGDRINHDPDPLYVNRELITSVKVLSGSP